MASKYEADDLRKINTISIRERENLVKLSDFAKVAPRGSSFGEFIDSLCSIEHRVDAASNLRNLLSYLARAKRSGKPIVWGIGPHVVKYGLPPLIINLMDEGYVSALTLNGACAIHDSEIAMVGETSEEMAGSIVTGRFGMARETGELINGAAKLAQEKDLGLGEAIAVRLLEGGTPHGEYSLLVSAYNKGIPATVHVAIGTDIIHMQPTMDGSAMGAATFRDFRILTHVMSDFGDGGVYLNIASSVVLPEVFLKALTAANNLRGESMDDFTTANFNHQSEYRPLMNVVRRPTEGAGRGYEIIGRIEIMIPLLARAVLELE